MWPFFAFSAWGWWPVDIVSILTPGQPSGLPPLPSHWSVYHASMGCAHHTLGILVAQTSTSGWAGLRSPRVNTDDASLARRRKHTNRWRAGSLLLRAANAIHPAAEGSPAPQAGEAHAITRACAPARRTNLPRCRAS